MIRRSIRTLQQLDQHPQGHASANRGTANLTSRPVNTPQWQPERRAQEQTIPPKRCQCSLSARLLHESTTCANSVASCCLLGSRNAKFPDHKAKGWKKILSCLKFCLLLHKDLAIGASLALSALCIRSLTSPTGRAQRGPQVKPRNLTAMSIGLVKVSRKFHQLGSQNPVRTDHSFEPVKVRVVNKLQYVTIHLQMKPAGKPPGPWTVERKIAVRRLNHSSWLLRVFTCFTL